MSVLLGINIDHVATLRQARGTRYPDPVQAALIAEQAGADGITVHLREDRRHIQDRDVELLAAGSTEGLANTDVVDGLKTLSRTYGGARGIKAFASVGTALDAVERNLSPKVIADWLVCQL